MARQRKLAVECDVDLEGRRFDNVHWDRVGPALHGVGQDAARQELTQREFRAARGHDVRGVQLLAALEANATDSVALEQQLLDARGEANRASGRFERSLDRRGELT